MTRQGFADESEEVGLRQEPGNRLEWRRKKSNRKVDAREERAERSNHPLDDVTLLRDQEDARSQETEAQHEGDPEDQGDRRPGVVDGAEGYPEKEDPDGQVGEGIDAMPQVAPQHIPHHEHSEPDRKG